MTAMKLCKRCGVEKTLEEFSKHKKCKDGRQGTCVTCTAATTAAWTENNWERKQTIDREYEKRNPMRKSISRYLKKSLDPIKLSNLERDRNMYKRYGITIEEYGQLFYTQEGNCKICKRSHKEFARGLVIDHNHMTGKVRGLLCDPCNRALGYFRENIATMESAIQYVNQDTVTQIPSN